VVTAWSGNSSISSDTGQGRISDCEGYRQNRNVDSALRISEIPDEGRSEQSVYGHDAIADLIADPLAPLAPTAPAHAVS